LYSDTRAAFDRTRNADRETRAPARLIAGGLDNNDAVLDTILLVKHVLCYTRSEMLMRQDA
jgi:hypothetical protein